MAGTSREAYPSKLFYWISTPSVVLTRNEYLKSLFIYSFIHLFIFSVVGTLGRGPKWMVIEYGKLDARYWPTKDPMVMMISATEFFIMGPLCLLW